jgi:hypothetical protein
VDWKMVRFDIVSVVLREPPTIQWFRDAFRPPHYLQPRSTASPHL